jgi:hypothetical protein
MNQSAFATLAGVSRQQAHKYATAGKLVHDGAGKIDAAASLAALEGHLDEAKRQRALAALGVQPPAQQPSGLPLAPPARSTKMEKDELEIAIRRLELGQKAGELISVAEVDARAREAVSALRETFNNSRREIANRLCAQFGLPADKAVVVARFLAVEFEGAMGRFAEACAAMATGDDASGARTDAE